MAQGSAPPHPRGRALPVVDLPRAEDCVRCGACCFSRDRRYIALFAVDEERLPRGALALTQVVDGRRYMRMDGRCAALVVGDGLFRCSIYEARPDACRWLVPGSGACMAAREGP